MYLRLLERSKIKIQLKPIKSEDFPDHDLHREHVIF